MVWWKLLLNQEMLTAARFSAQEIIAIDMALDFVLELQLFREIWILSESRSVAQYLHTRRDGDRKDQTALARLSSGHIKTLRFSCGDKKFNICTMCKMIEATPQHLHRCAVPLVYDDLPKRPDFVLELMNANDLIDLI
ncbi:hypothetical protein AVEN_242108-1 [Araneus ventricosus]|uniref:RNase H type-1 domain-containing protein n=1 Tax=Araneus ventricosus TaxID=182803 RepID=A0A4Y2VKN8_ARAVE|nr:hypothetical protein AVEN_242108-1 [Araneus ventricosus]